MLSPAEIRERYAAVQAAVGPQVTVVAATKYVPVADMAVLLEAGVTVVGENRAQELVERLGPHGAAARVDVHLAKKLQPGRRRRVRHVRAPPRHS